MFENNNHLLEFCNLNGFRNTNKTIGTRLNTNKGQKKWTLLDVILCQNLKSLIDLTVIPYPRSDHALVIGMFNFKKYFPKKDQISSRCLNPKKIEAIREKFSNILPDFTLVHPDPNKQWSLVKDIINSTINSVAPLKKMNIKHEKQLPFYDKELIYLSRTKDKTYYNMINSDSSDLELHKEKIYVANEAKNKYTAAFKEKKANYIKSFIDSVSVSTKRLWTKMDSLINPNRKTKIISNNILKGQSNNTDKDAANIFVNFFSSITNIFSFLHVNICLAYVNIFLRDNFKQKIPTVPFGLEPITIKEVEKAFKSLSANSSKGAVGIDTIIFKECATELAPVFTNLFNSCLEKSSIPDEWKIAHLTPVTKARVVNQM